MFLLCSSRSRRRWHPRECSRDHQAASSNPWHSLLPARRRAGTRLGDTYAPCEEQQLRALRMLADFPNGATTLTLLMHAFEKRCMSKLVAARETRTGLHVDRYRITQAGQEAAAV